MTNADTHAANAKGGRKRAAKRKVDPAQEAARAAGIASAKIRRGKFLRSTAIAGTLAAGLAAGVLMPGSAQAACAVSSGSTTNVTRNCFSPPANVGVGVVVTGKGVGSVGVDAAVNNSGSVSNTTNSGNAIDVNSLGGNASYTGNGNVNSQAGTGVNFLGLGNASVSTTGGSITGNGGDGLAALMPGSVTVNSINTDYLGSDNGLNLAGTAVSVTLTNGSATGLGGDGISAVSLGTGGTGGSTAVETKGSAAVLGGDNGIFAVSTGLNTNTSTTVIVNGAGGSTGETGFGVSALSLSGSLNSGELDATTTVKGRAPIDGKEGGVLAVAASIDGNPASFDPNDPDASLIGDGKATVIVDTSGGVTSSDGTGVTALAVGKGGNKVDVDTRGGLVEGGNGFGVLAGSIGDGATRSDVKVQTNDVSGTAGGVLGFNQDGNTSVTTNGNVSVAKGGLIGVGAISGNDGDATVRFNGTIDPPLIGAGTLAIGTGTASTNTTGSIDADLAGAIAVNIGDGHAAVDNKATVFSSSGSTPFIGVGALKFGNNNASGPADVSVKNTGDVSDYAFGVLGYANGDGNDVKVTNTGSVTDSVIGVAGVAVGAGNGATVDVDNAGVIEDNTGVGVLGLAIGANYTVKVENSASVESDGAGVLGGAIGDNGDVKVTSSGPVEAGFLGVGGFVAGDSGKVKVSTTSGGSVTSDGAGVVGALIGDRGTVDVETKGSVDGKFLGVGGLIGGDNNKLAITTYSDVTSSDGFGVAGLGFGNSNEIKVTTKDSVSGDLLGVGALNIGNDSSVTILTERDVSSASGFGVFGGAIGATGNNKVKITTEEKVDGALLGVGGLIGGDNSELTIQTKGRVTSSDGFGVAGLGFGDTNKIKVTTEDTVDGKLLGVGALNLGDNSEVTVLTQKKVTSSDGFGVLGGAIGLNGGNTVKVTTEDEVEGKLLGVGGIIGGDGSDLTIVTKKKVTSSDGFGVAGLGFGNGNTIKVTTEDEVSGKYLGVGALNFGGGDVTVETQKKVVSSDGVGVIGGTLFGNVPSNVSVTTKDTVEGKYLGVGGVTGTDGSTLKILTEKEVTSSDGFGVFGAGFGDGSSIDVNTKAKVTGDLLGVGALQVGDNATVKVVTDGEVESATGVGVVGGAIGTGGTVNVTTNKAVKAGFAGVVAFNTGGDATATNEDKVSVDGGLVGVYAVAGGSGNATANINAAIDPPSIGGGAFTFGSGTATTNVNASVQANDVGILGGNIGTGNVDINVNAGGTIESGGTGIVGLKLGNGSTSIDVDAAITGLPSPSATPNDGIFVFNAFGDGQVHVATTVNGTINAADDGISINKFFSGGDTEVFVGGAITAGEDGVDIDQFVGNGDIWVQNTATINAGVDAIRVTKILGEGDVTVRVLNNLTAGDDGVRVLSGVTLGDISIATASYTTIKAGDDGIEAISAVNIGNIGIATGDYSRIEAGDDGIRATKAIGLGGITIATGYDSTIVAGDDGIHAESLADGALVGIDITTGAYSDIAASDDGIEAEQGFAAGAVKIETGSYSNIVAGDDGIRATSFASLGNVSVTTGYESFVYASDDGITARKLAGSGDVSVTTGSYSLVRAGDDGIIATNFAFGPGNDVAVTTGYAARVIADDDGIRAGGWDNVTVSTGVNGWVRGDYDENGAGNGVRIFEAENASLYVGAGSTVSGSGQSWSQAVVSIDSDDSTFIEVGTGALVTSWKYDRSTLNFANNNLVGAASDIVIDTDGGATTINNFGTIIGRIGLTGEADVFNNYSSNTWITVGNNYFGGGSDLLNNEGHIQTALVGDVAETTNLFSLESFVNGDTDLIQAGTLSMQDGEAWGDIAFNGARDVTYTSGTFEGVGNSRLAVDTFLGAPGSTSDKLVIGGYDVDGNPLTGYQTTFGQTKILVNDVNAGAGAFNLDGILVVDVQNGLTYGKYDPGHTANFVIDPDSWNYDSKFGGVIDKGLFFYDIVVKDTPDGGEGHYLVGVPDGEVFELPKFVTGAQSIWHETAGVWLDRQVDLRSYLLNPTPGPTTTIVTKDSGIVKAPVAVAPESITPGVWAKAIGSWGSRDSNDSFSAFGGKYQFNTSYDQDTYGFIAGADFGKTDGETAYLFGVLAGYVTSQLDFDNSPTSGDYSGATVGAYATYINKGFFIDALFKADLLDLDYSAPTLYGYNGETVDSTSIGFTIDTGYRFAWGDKAFFEPVATLAYVQTDIDNLVGIDDAIVNFGDGDSLRGSLGARVGGKVYETETYWLEASAVGRFWYEFEGNNTATVLNPGLPFQAFDDFGGGFGEVGGYLNWFGKQNGWNGFVNANVKFGNDYTAGTGQAGIRYQW
ncbi:hypothetical protein [Ancylobacter terrae]|uniref:hypothetical protein n=1 Tax=Ancylobacter sp. sgz301288 TaxID=3342077 RepID=UPI00385B10CF